MRSLLCAAALVGSTLFGWSGALGAPVPPSTHLGLAAGGHLVVTDWEAGLTDATGAAVSPEADGFVRVRLGQQLNGWLGVEAAVTYLPLSAGDAVATALIYDGDLLINLREGPVMPLLVVGGGAYHVFGDESDLDGQFHYGFELRGTLNERVAVRGGLRHIFADSFEPDQDFSNHIELSFGFDLLFGAE